jgi:hypothetical protein
VAVVDHSALRLQVVEVFHGRPGWPSCWGDDEHEGTRSLMAGALPGVTLRMRLARLRAMLPGFT